MRAVELYSNLMANRYGLLIVGAIPRERGAYTAHRESVCERERERESKSEWERVKETERIYVKERE